jgi:hypothetical protein
MRTAINNPFTPGSDTVPVVWAGRIAQLTDWERVVRPRRLSGLPERGRTILGEAGLGKSSLVRLIAATAEREGDWVTPQLRIPAGTDSLKAVAAAVLTLADKGGLAVSREKRIRDLLHRVRAVAVQGMSLTLDRAEGPEPYHALSQLLVEVGIAAMKAERAVLVHLDEMQNVTGENELSQLLIALGDAITHEETVVAPGGVELSRALPIAVYLTGLPDFADLAGARKGATFARRFATTVLTPIDDDDLTMSLRPFVTDGWEVPDGDGGTTRVWMTPDAAEQIVALCHGEPFLFQLAGERAWYAGSSSHITADDVRDGWAGVVGEASLHVERILERLPERERRFVEVMAALEPGERTLTTIAQRMGFTEATQLGTTAQRLDTIRGIVERGRPYTFRHRAVEAYLTTSWPRVQ